MFMRHLLKGKGGGCMHVPATCGWVTHSFITAAYLHALQHLGRHNDRLPH